MKKRVNKHSFITRARRAAKRENLTLYTDGGLYGLADEEAGAVVEQGMDTAQLDKRLSVLKSFEEYID